MKEHGLSSVSSYNKYANRGTFMKSQISAKTLASAAMFAALTFLATSVLKIPTPTLGYIHIGDAFVLLSGVLFGPLTGGLAAGLGSALADLLGGYVIWAPFTFVVKFLTAFTAALSILPVEMVGIPSSLQIISACVPLPAPGAPNIIIFIYFYLLIIISGFFASLRMTVGTDSHPEERSDEGS